MELMEGGSLEEKLQNHQPLPENSVISYLTQILEGGSFLHRREIYHSDIKPANILFTADDKLKISDFGIAVGSLMQTKSSATASHFLKATFITCLQNGCKALTEVQPMIRTSIYGALAQLLPT